MEELADLDTMGRKFRVRVNGFIAISGIPLVY
jgi:hypothetical protein